ncbi:uncharacterized protein LOC102409528 isoform X2 [Bubalus bubalis]|uniref:uncharacterized protein LOC102409528 isoform X2 n=1 Tax=Bubalus bubalis TaxID=89462 RepID=UPI001D1201A8|nr:uncharacterized protein LOC102409528 isoform X2 [Bubalus bubalis]
MQDCCTERPRVPAPYPPWAPTPPASGVRRCLGGCAVVLLERWQERVFSPTVSSAAPGRGGRIKGWHDHCLLLMGGPSQTAPRPVPSTQGKSAGTALPRTASPRQRRKSVRWALP